MKEDIERRRMEAAERMKSLSTSSVDGDETFSPFSPKTPTHKVKKEKPHVDPANAAAGLFSHHQSHLWILYKKWMFVRYVVLNYGCKMNLQSRTRRINFGIVIIETLELRLTRVGDAKLTCVKYYIQFVFH